MTGFGEAHQQADGLAVMVEVRTINNRYFKFSMRSGEGYSALESQIEAVVREKIKRGTVQVNLQVQRATSPDDYSINSAVLESYRLNFKNCNSRWGTGGEVPLENLLDLPGVVNEKLSDPERGRGRLASDSTHACRQRLNIWAKCGATRGRRWPPI